MCLRLRKSLRVLPRGIGYRGERRAPVSQSFQILTGDIIALNRFNPGVGLSAPLEKGQNPGFRGGRRAKGPSGFFAPSLGGFTLKTKEPPGFPDGPRSR